MSDIAFSADTYKTAIARIRAYDKEVGTWRAANPAQQREERKRLTERADALTKERDTQSNYVERMRKGLRSESATWFGQRKSQLSTRASFFSSVSNGLQSLARSPLGKICHNSYTSTASIPARS